MMAGEYIMLTRAQLDDIIARTVEATMARLEHRTVTGIPGIAQLFGCSISQAKRIKQSGVLDPAIMQRGRTIVVDAEKALRLWGDGKR